MLQQYLKLYIAELLSAWQCIAIKQNKQTNKIIIHKLAKSPSIQYSSNVAIWFASPSAFEAWAEKQWEFLFSDSFQNTSLTWMENIGSLGTVKWFEY